MPKVSIGFPVYNGAVLIERALDSILAQTFTDFEVVITDNCSTDETEQICRTYAERDSRITYVRNDENVGASPNFQKAFHLSSCEYFRWAAHDDFIDPTYLERCVEVLDDNPNAAIVFTGMGTVDDDGKVKKTSVESIDGAESASAFTRFHRIIWSLQGWTSPVFGLARREMLERSGLVRNSPEPDRVLLG